MVSVNVGGKNIDIKFEKMSSNIRGVSYITDDENLQKALENTKAFGRSFNVDKKFVSNEADLKDNKDMPEKIQTLKEIKFLTVNEAKDFFNKKHGIPVSKLMTRAAIISEAEKLGFEVQFDNQ